MIRKRQFSLRALFFLVTTSAILLLIWRCRPAPVLEVQLTSQGNTLVCEVELEAAALEEKISREAHVRRIWRMEPVMTLLAHPSVQQADVVNIITLSQQAGFKQFTLTTEAVDGQSEGE